MDSGAVVQRDTSDNQLPITQWKISICMILDFRGVKSLLLSL